MKRFIIVTLGTIVAFFNRIMPAYAMCTVGTGELADGWSDCALVCDIYSQGNMPVVRPGVGWSSGSKYQCSSSSIDHMVVSDHSEDSNGTLHLDPTETGGFSGVCPERYRLCKEAAGLSGVFVFNTTGVDYNGGRGTCKQLVCDLGVASESRGCDYGRLWYDGDIDRFYTACYRTAPQACDPDNISWVRTSGSGVSGSTYESGTCGERVAWISGSAPAIGCVNCDAVRAEEIRTFRCADGHYFSETGSILSGTTGWYVFGSSSSDIKCAVCPSPDTYTPKSPTGISGCLGNGVCSFAGQARDRNGCFVLSGQDSAGTFTFDGWCGFDNSFTTDPSASGGTGGTGSGTTSRTCMIGYETKGNEAACSNYASLAASCQTGIVTWPSNVTGIAGTVGTTCYGSSWYDCNKLKCVTGA